MKKYLIVSIILVLFLPCLIVNGAASDVIGHIYSTDILAFVNDQPIEGFNIGGKTVVIAEDLEYYGFTYYYDDEQRLLSVMSNFHEAYNEFAQIPRGKTGKIVGNVYETDIKVTFNGLPITGYNVGGRTAICLEDMGDLSDSQNVSYGYSKYLGITKWNEQERIVSFKSYISNEHILEGVSRINYKFRDNVIYVYSDEFSARSEITALENDEDFSSTYNYSDGFNKYVMAPLYLDINGERFEIGTAVVVKDVSWSIININDVAKTRDLVKKVKLPQKSHDEAIDYFASKYEIAERIENDNYTVLMINDEKDGRFFVFINKSGGFVIEFAWGNNPTEIKMWFDESGINADPNTFVYSIYPFGGPHGTTTANIVVHLDTYDYE